MERLGRLGPLADGDTLTVLDESHTQHKIRLAGIDAPEKGQTFGAKARENLATKVFGKQGNLAPPTTQVGQACSHGAGCSGGKFTGNFFH